MAETKCFLVRENQQTLYHEGDCSKRYSPCSTFKIAISLMGYEEGLLVDEYQPVIKPEELCSDWLQMWKQPHDPTQWIKNSCVWFSQILTQRLGMNKFQDYIVKFDYGNQDVSGNKGKNDGLTLSWLNSSLKISVEEQVAFLQAMVNNTFNLNPDTIRMSKKILFVETIALGWQLYGKTGMGYLTRQDRCTKIKLQHGWFVGWIENNNRTITFAYHLNDDLIQNNYASQRAKAAARKILLQIISEITCEEK